MVKGICLSLLLILSMISYGQQQGKLSFYAQGGYKSSGYIKESAHNEIASAKETAHHKCIVLNAGFLVNIADKWRIGPAFTYDHFGTKHRSVEFSNLSYMLRCDRTWKAAKTYSLYSHYTREYRLAYERFVVLMMKLKQDATQHLATMFI